MRTLPLEHTQSNLPTAFRADLLLFIQFLNQLKCKDKLVIPFSLNFASSRLVPIHKKNRLPLNQQVVYDRNVRCASSSLVHFDIYHSHLFQHLYDEVRRRTRKVCNSTYDAIRRFQCGSDSFLNSAQVLSTPKLSNCLERSLPNTSGSLCALLRVLVLRSQTSFAGAEHSEQSPRNIPR